MPLAGVAGAQPKRPRPGARGSIRAGKSFNHLPAIIAAFPQALSAIVAETADDLGILSASLAPVESAPKQGDPTPGTLRSSEKTKLFLARASDTIITGRVDFMAKDPRGHRYAKPLETGSIRRSRRGLRRVAARPFLVDAIVTMRPVFIERLAGLESRLPS